MKKLPYIDLKRKASNYAKIEKLLTPYIASSGWEPEAYANYVNFIETSQDGDEEIQLFKKAHDKISELDALEFKPSILYSGIVTSDIKSNGTADFKNYFHAFSVIELVQSRTNNTEYLRISHQGNGRKLFTFGSFKADGNYILWNLNAFAMIVNKQPIHPGITCRQIENATIAWWNETDRKHRKTYPGSCTGLTDTLIYLFAQNPQASVDLFATDKEKQTFVPIMKVVKGKMFQKKTIEPLKQDDAINPELYEKLTILGFVGVNPNTIDKFEHAIDSADMILN